ncbi:MAG: DinB family protein [Bacteroidota bacterium]
MINKSLLEELYRHMDWADATVWKKVYGNEAAIADDNVKALLFHVHYAQYAYLQQWNGLPFERLKPDDFVSLDAIYAWMRPHYKMLHGFLANADETGLPGPMSLPWSKYYGRQLGIEPADTTLGETMLHLSCHGIHHRAQLNTLLRKLGTEPPLIDYIAWLWHGRPLAVWENGAAAN